MFIVFIGVVIGIMVVVFVYLFVVFCILMLMSYDGLLLFFFVKVNWKNSEFVIFIWFVGVLGVVVVGFVDLK